VFNTHDYKFIIVQEPTSVLIWLVLMCYLQGGPKMSPPWFLK